MGLAQIASILDQDGFKIRVEDLIDKSDFNEQVGLLAAERKKQVEKEEMSPWGEKGERAKAVAKGRKDELKLERKESGFGALAKKIGLKRTKTGEK